MPPKTHQAPTKALCILPLFAAFLPQSCRRTSARFCKPLEEPTQTRKKGQPKPTTAQTASTSIRCRGSAKVKTSQPPPCQRIAARRICRNPCTIHHRDTLPTTSAHTNHLAPPKCWRACRAPNKRGGHDTNDLKEPVGLLDNLSKKTLGTKTTLHATLMDNVALETAGLTSTEGQSCARSMRGTLADSTIAPVSFAVNVSVYDVWKSDLPLFWLASAFAEEVDMNALFGTRPTNTSHRHLRVCFSHTGPHCMRNRGHEQARL